MENALKKIPYVMNILEARLSKERKEAEYWNSQLTSTDTLVIRQANSNINSNKERVRQLEEAMLELCPIEQRPKNENE